MTMQPPMLELDPPLFGLEALDEHGPERKSLTCPCFHPAWDFHALALTVS